MHNMVTGVHHILVTGGSGYVASRLILQLLDAGFQVRTTVRNTSREKHIRQVLEDAGAETKDRLSFVVANLSQDDGWAEAVEGCDVVQHVASPFFMTEPDDEEDMIRPAREGTLRVLRFSRDAGVRRVVMTSSFAAIGFGHRELPQLFDEATWSVLEGGTPVPVYHKSKTLAERAAWDFIRSQGGGLELVVLNPTGIFGPVLSADVCASVGLVKTMMEGKMPACPRLSFGLVDVRDLADLHIRVMMAPEASGQRIIATTDGDPPYLMSIANIIREAMPHFADKMPRWELPDVVVRVMGRFSATMRTVSTEVGIVKRISNTRAKSLGWRPRSVEECIVDTAESLVKFGAV